MGEEENDVRYVLVGTEGGTVRYVRVLSDPIAEFQAIEEADRMASQNKRKGVKVVVWDHTIDKVIHVSS
jgi:hypothetical protein